MNKAIAEAIANKISVSFSVGCHCTTTEMCAEHKNLAKIIYDNSPKMVDISSYNHYKILTSTYKPSGGEQAVFKDRYVTTKEDCDCCHKDK